MARRILLLITDLEIGGTPTVVRELAVRLNDPPRVEIEVACLSPWGPVADQIRAAGVPVTALGGRGAADLPRVLWRLVRLVRRGGFDTVFSFLLHANATATAAGAFCPGVRLLQSIQTTQPYPRWHWRVQRLIHPAADAVVVPSPSVAEVAAKWAGVPAGKVVVIPNAVDVASFDSLYHTPKPRRKPLAIPSYDPDNALRVGFIGRLDPVKRVPALVAAMVPLSGSQLHIFGEGPERARIEAEVARLGLAGRVTLHGAVARPHEALEKIDVLVLPSLAEGFGLVLIEAMAAGVPVVATKVAGIRDVIEHCHTGVFCGPSAGGIKCGVMTANYPYVRQRVISAARAAVEQRYAWPVVLAAYRRLLGLAG